MAVSEALVRMVSVVAAVSPSALMGPLAILAVLAGVGLFLLLVQGSKWGWLFIVAGGAYAWYAFLPIIRAAGGG